MKKLTKLVSVFGLASVIAVTAARGQSNTITLDEFGKGFYNNAPVGSGSIPDPFNGGTPHFAYTLPFLYLWSTPQADIQLFEPGATLPSDLLRFTRDPNGPNTLLFFYSDAFIPGDAPDAPADVVGLPNPGFLFLATAETGLFANPYSEASPNGLVYMANPGTPGADGTGVPLQYTFISDGVVPEPSSLALLASGLGMLYGYTLRRQARAGTRGAQNVRPATN